MFDIISEIQKLVESNAQFVTATVVKTWGSGPRKVGAGMIIGPDNIILGSVSGGCVEGDVVKNAGEVLATGERKLVHYGITDEEAWEVGLSCGGQIEILLEKVDTTKSEAWKELSGLITRNIGCVITSPLSGTVNSQIAHLEQPSNGPIATSALNAYAKRKSGVYEIEGTPYFHNVFPKKSQLVIVGSAHISSQLVELASIHDFETIVVDPRGLFSDNTSFKVEPDSSHKMWPARAAGRYES